MKPGKKQNEVSKSSNSDRRNGKKPKQNPGQGNSATGRTVKGYLPEKFAAREQRRAPLNLSSPILKKGRSRRKA